MSADLERWQSILQILGDRVVTDPSRESLVQEAITRREAFVSACGALATWGPPESTGRNPKDTVTVYRAESAGEIDWDSPNNLPISPETFDLLLADALGHLQRRERVYLTRRCLGANPCWAMPVFTVTDRALTALFTCNMFRPLPASLADSPFRDRPFVILAVPWEKLDPDRYAGRLRIHPSTGRTTTLAVATDFDRRIGVILGTAYLGAVKKMAFTAMNYYLPPEGILPLHASANAGHPGDTALLLGLSGTGKTTLSTDSRRPLIGDDEHGWGPDGIANFENGCYAKLVHLDPAREPEIHQAVFHEAPTETQGTIIENAFMLPWGVFDLDDERLTSNSRASYPLSSLRNVVPSGTGGHPRTIFFLAADANGVLPPIARLTPPQAMLWFLMGYTSKLAGTETGVQDPQTTFSRFFGEPFMPRHPAVYAGMLGDRLRQHGTEVYLVNTGWSGGPHGVGRRMDIRLTRALIDAALSGALRDVPCQEDRRFHLLVPKTCPGIPSPDMLWPRSAWADAAAYDARADRLAGEFARHFRKTYGGKGLDPRVVAECPGL